MTDIPFSESKYLCISSCLIGISSCILYFLREYKTSFFSGVLCVTSLNHWRDYVHKGWRQRVDIAWIIVFGIYFMLSILYYRSEFYIYLSLAVVTCLLIFFHISRKHEKYWIVAHSAMHLYFSFFVPLSYIL